MVTYAIIPAHSYLQYILFSNFCVLIIVCITIFEPLISTRREKSWHVKILLNPSDEIRNKLQPRMHSKVGAAGLPDFSWSEHTKTEKVYQIVSNYTKRPYIILNGHKLYQNCRKKQHFPFQGPPNYNQIGAFGLKRNHLATLDAGSRKKF
jgi:hypothetical protein